MRLGRAKDKHRDTPGVAVEDHAYFLDGTYLDNLDDDDDEGDGLGDSHGCLRRFRICASRVVQPRRYSVTVLSWVGFDEHRYSALY